MTLKHKKLQKVVAAYPHSTHVSARFLKSWDALRQYDFANRQRICVGGGHLPNSSGANVTNARNEIIAAFLDKHDADWLWFVDTDMVFDPDILDRLVEAAHPEQRPIMGALCFSIQDGWRARPTLYVIRDDRKIGVVSRYEPGETMRVLTGTGCLLLHRTALEQIRARQFNPAYLWCQETNIDTLPVGEDITLCLRAESLGIPVHVATSIKCGHEKTYVVDEDVFVAQQAEHAPDIADPVLPTFAVIASIDRPDLLANLRGQLAPQVTDTFLFDNGYPVAPEGSIDAHGWPLHRMWNEGLALAEKAAAGKPHNVLILNDDIEVPRDFAAHLEAGLRSCDGGAISYPCWHPNIRLHRGGARITPGNGRRTLSGWAFMLAGELGYRFDEQFDWWYGDDDLQRQVEADGRHVVAVGVECAHLHPNETTEASPERRAQAAADKVKYEAKW